MAAVLGSCTINFSGAAPAGTAPSAAPAVPEPGSSAQFEHFAVTVSRLDNDADHTQALLLAKVCVTSLPPSYVGKQIRISWDPWSVTAGTRTAEAGYQGKAPTGLFPSDRAYKVGACATGRIPFEIAGDLQSVKYANSVGDTAVWDANQLDNHPMVSHLDARGNRQAN